MRIAVVAHTPLEAPHMLARDDAIAVDTNEARAEFVFETCQRFFEQEFALACTNRDVLELSLQVHDVFNRYQDDARTLRDRQKAARRRRKMGKLVGSERSQARHLLQGG